MIFYVKYNPDDEFINPDNKIIYVGVDDENEEAWIVTEDEALKEIRVTVDWSRLSDWEMREVYKLWNDKFNPNPEIPEQPVFNSPFTTSYNYNVSIRPTFSDGSVIEPVVWITPSES